MGVHVPAMETAFPQTRVFQGQPKLPTPCSLKPVGPREGRPLGWCPLGSHHVPQVLSGLTRAFPYLLQISSLLLFLNSELPTGS